MELSRKQIESLKNLIQEKLKEIEKSLEDIKESTKPVTLDQSAVGRVSRIDAIQQQQVQLASKARMEQEKTALMKTLERIDTGEDYGLCKKCEELIPFARLQIRPESPYCMDCLKKMVK